MDFYLERNKICMGDVQSDEFMLGILQLETYMICCVRGILTAKSN